MAAVTLVDISSVGDDGSGNVLQPSSDLPQFNIISLQDPSNNDDGASTTSMREYMIVSCNKSSALSTTSNTSSQYNIYEIQTVLPHSGKYASHFIGSRIISNPALHVTTRIEPLFFALAHFQRIMSKDEASAEQLSKWQPWDQALNDIPTPILRALNLDTKLSINGISEVGQLGHLLDISDMCGDDLILCKFSEERTLKWLVAKYEKSVVALRKRFHEKKVRGEEKSQELSNMAGGSGAFSSSFNMEVDEKKTEDNSEKEKDSDIKDGDKADESTLSEVEEHHIKVGALQLICDYIPTEWRKKLGKEVGIAEEEWAGKKKIKTSASSHSNDDGASAGEKRSRSSWEGSIGQEDADALYQYTQGGGGGGNSSSVITPADKADVKNAQSMGLKRLAKVNKKGMKSLTSFFGASKTKK